MGEPSQTSQIPLNHILDTISNAVFLMNKKKEFFCLNTSAHYLISGSAGYNSHEKAGDFLSKLGVDHAIAEGEEKSATALLGDLTYQVTVIPMASKGHPDRVVVVVEDVSQAGELSRQFEACQRETSLLKYILETAYDGLVVTDSNGRITMMSNAYKGFLGVTDQDVVGKHITDVVENTRLHIVAKTGVAEINDIQRIQGNHMVASRIPYTVDGKLAGVVGKVIFQDVDELGEINKKLETMEKELNRYRNEISKLHQARYCMDVIFTRNARMEALKNHARVIAQSDSNVLILGESGTGKELFAHAIHQESTRSFQPFIRVNCAAIPENLLESELFGHEKGAFTGASSTKLGKFELANNGTIFLDEIGDMPLQMQAKILRVLQEGEVEHIGASRPKRVDVRVIAATNKNLSEMVEKKTFREDLLYRLNVFTLTIPPLKRRREDIELIAGHAICALNRKMKRGVKGVSPKASCLLQAYSWPGNIRELKNVVERAYHIMEGEELIQPWHLPHVLRGGNLNASQEPLKYILENMERKVITERLILHSGNKTKTAADLGISRVALHKKLEKYSMK
ncbi:pas fold [Desulfoluna spongiiphila]|nr:pas fold [Desulfoluna spongiiphila]